MTQIVRGGTEVDAAPYCQANTTNFQTSRRVVSVSNRPTRDGSIGDRERQTHDGWVEESGRFDGYGIVDES